MQVRKMKAAAALALGLLAAGCSNGGGDLFEKDKPYTLKVLYTDQETFMERYGYYIQAEYPNVELQVVPTRDIIQVGSLSDMKQGLVDIMQKEQPDLLFLPSWQMSMVQEEEQLKPLNHLLSTATIRNLHPGVKHMLEQEGDGELYSVAMSFTASAVYYNKDLFDENGIPVPTEQLDGLQLLELASRFQAGDAVGLYQPSMDDTDLMTMIGLSEGLSYVNRDKDQSTVLLDTDSWADIAERMKAARGTGAVMLLDEADEAGRGDMFRKGQAAITLTGSDYANQLEEAAVPFEWGVLPVPNPSPEKMGIYPESMVAINKNSGHAEDAAKLINYIQSDKISRLLQNVSTELSSSMTSAIAVDDAHPLHFMYTKEAETAGLDSEKWAQYLRIDFRDYFHNTVRSMMAGEIDVREGLKSIEQFGNEQQP